MLDQLTAREIEILERLTAGLADQQIAVELFLSANTVRWYNRQIYSKLGVGSRTQAIARAKDLGLLERGASSAQAAVKTNLPAFVAGRTTLPAQTTSFIGRKREASEVKALLEANRLLTLTGTGGIGKTRLSLHVAAEVEADFADGVTFVNLAPLTDAGMVGNAIGSALGIAENANEPLMATLKRALAPQQVLLVIDNFEHVIAAAPLVSDLLAACPRLKVLVTSRETLRLSGEQEYAVPPLHVAAAGEPVETRPRTEAESLFFNRARLSRLQYESEMVENDEAIAEICRRLDGLPLAIELAAARCKLLPPIALLRRLNESPLHTLAGGMRDAPPRHRTLRDSIAWSYDLLDEGEKTLFARLAVFRGGRSLEAVEAVCCEGLDIDVLDGLASLVDKSLVQQKEVGGEPRFVMLEMIQEYAGERLEESGKAEAIRRRHAETFVAMAERAEPEMRLAGYDRWCQRFELELDNIRAALAWSLNSGYQSDDLSLGVRLIGAMAMFWFGKGYHVEGLRWIQPLLERLDDVPVNYHAKFLYSAAHLILLHDLDAGTAMFARSASIAHELGDKMQEAWSTILRGYTMQRNPEAAVPVVEAGLAVFRDVNHLPGIAQSLNILGEIARLNGDDTRAAQYYEACLDVCAKTGELRRICYLHHNLAFIAQHEGDHERAIRLAKTSLEIAQQRNDERDISTALSTLAGSLAMTNTLKAARLLGAADTAFERMGAFFIPTDTPEIQRIVVTIRLALGEEAFQAAWESGRAMGLENAVRLALNPPAQGTAL